VTTLEVLDADSLRLIARLIKYDLGNEGIGLDGQRVALSNGIFDVLANTFACSSLSNQGNRVKSGGTVAVWHTSVWIAEQCIRKTNDRFREIKTGTDDTSATSKLADKLGIAYQDAWISWVDRLPFVYLVQVLAHVLR
jgi:hypothetical protein